MPASQKKLLLELKQLKGFYQLILFPNQNQQLQFNMEFSPILLKPSKYLATFVLLSHLGALVTLYPLDMQIWQKGFLVGLVLISFTVIWIGTVLQRGRRCVVAIHPNQHDEWSLTTAEGSTYAGRL